MPVEDILQALSHKAQTDPSLRESLIATRSAANPISSFCQIARDNGYELYDMDLIDAGESFHAAMKRSTNGGGENSSMLTGQDDYYEMFIEGLTSIGIESF